MRFAGTISIPEDAFKGMLEGTRRAASNSKCFTDVVLIGDHGGYQGQLRTVAARLNHEWAAGTPARAHFHRRSTIWCHLKCALRPCAARQAA